MQNIGEQLGYSALEDYRAHPSLVTTDAVGVELELEGFTSSDVETARRHLNPHWTVTSDGSLRNGGVEFITTGGKGGEVLYQAYERITTLLRDTVNYDASWRCSTHMHLNMLDFTCNQVARYMLVYAACEPVLFALAGDQRRSSNFCTPLADSLIFHKKLISRLYDDTVANRLASAQTSKYTALNFQPLFGNQNVRPLGTIEFRGGRPMTTMEELLLQTNILLSIKQFVRTFEGTEDEMLVKLNDGVFNTVFQNGCAASLDYVKVDDLESALIHSWLLLKSYQEGMKSPPQSPRACRPFGDTAPEPIMDWNATAARIAARRQNTAVVDDFAAPPRRGDVRPYWSASQLRGSTNLIMDRNDYTMDDLARLHPSFNGHQWPQLARYLGYLQNPDSSKSSKVDAMVRVLCDSANTFHMSSVEARYTVTNWILSSNRQETTPIGTILRAIVNRMLPLGIREKECLDDSSSSTNQPTYVAVFTNVDYIPSLGGVSLSRISHLLNYPVELINNRFIWQTMMNTMVRLSSKRQLLNAFFSVTSNDIARELPDNIPACMAYYLFRIANVRSEDHLSPEELAVYDKIVGIMDTLISVNKVYPVIFRWNDPQRVTAQRYLYVTGRRDHALGFPARPQHVVNHQSHEPRVSVTTGQRVY